MLSNLRSGGVSLTCFVPVACRPFTQDSVFSFFGWGPRLPSDVCYLSVTSQRQDSFEFTCLGVHVSAPWRCHGSWRRSTSSSETFPIKAGLSFYGGFEEIFKTIDVGYHFFYHFIQYSTITSLPLHFVIPLQESTYVLAHGWHSPTFQLTMMMIFMMLFRIQISGQILNKISCQDHWGYLSRETKRGLLWSAPQHFNFETGCCWAADLMNILDEVFAEAWEIPKRWVAIANAL